MGADYNSAVSRVLEEHVDLESAVSRVGGNTPKRSRLRFLGFVSMQFNYTVSVNMYIGVINV